MVGLLIGLSYHSHAIASDILAKRGVHMVTGDDYPPFTDLDEPEGGLANILLRRIFEVQDIPFNDVEWLPWARGFEETAKGSYDGTYPYIYLAERSARFMFSAPLYSDSEYVWTHRSNALTPKSMADLQGTVFCRPLGYGNIGIIGEYVATGKLIRITPNTMEQCFKLAANHRVDFVVTTLHDAHNGIKDAGYTPTDFNQSVFTTNISEYRVLVGRANPHADEIIKSINNGLKLLKENGEYGKIMAGYF